jgi:hypothetical protein
MLPRFCEVVANSEGDIDHVRLHAFWHIVGADRTEEQKSDEDNLATGVWLELQYPHIAKRSCDHCKKWWYDHEKGRVIRTAQKMVPRPEGTPLPCETQQGCVKGTPENPQTLSPKNQQAYQHYLKCKATGSFPQDDTVIRNAMIISEIERKSFIEQVKTTVRDELCGRA